MPRGALSPEEESAGTIVAQQVGGKLVALDVLGAPDATHDLDVLLPDGRRIALEVTSAGDEAVEALRREALGRVWEAPTLAHHWWIGLPIDGRIRVRDLMSEVIPHLEVLERHAVERVGGLARADRWSPAEVHQEPAAAAGAVLRLGVSHATRLGPPKPGEAARVMASLHGGAGSNFDAMNDLVSECARKKIDKLMAATGDERHLFVWIRSSASDAELAIATLPPPASPPGLPDGIDAVWVATSGGPDALYARLLRLRPPGAWETIGAPSPSA
jgi:hypothetical protein